VRGRGRAERGAARPQEWRIPAADAAAGAAEVARLVHSSLPELAWGRSAAGVFVTGPVPAPRPLPGDLSDAEHSAFLVRLAGLLSFLSAHGLGLSAEGAFGLGAKPATRDVPWLVSPPVPAWRSVSAPAALGGVALRLAGREPRFNRQSEARTALAEALSDRLPVRTAEIVAAVLRSVASARPSDALLLDLARACGGTGKVALDLLGLVTPRELDGDSGERLVATGPAAEWVARGAARRAPGEVAFAETGSPGSIEEGAPLLALADGLGPDPRAEVLRALARGEPVKALAGPPLVLLARGFDSWGPGAVEAWEAIPDVLPGIVRLETRAEAPPPWQRASLVVPRLGREEVSSLVHLPHASPSAAARIWTELAEEAAGDAGRLLRAARRKARAFLAAGPSRSAPGRASHPESEVVLRASALLAEGFPPEEAAAVSGLGAACVADVLDEAVDEGTLLRTARGLYRFADPGQRQRLAGSLRPVEKEAGIARLEAACRADARLLLARLAAFGERPDVVDQARRRLLEAAQNGEPEELLALLSRAPASDPDLGAPLVALETFAAAGRMEDARRAADRIVPRDVASVPLARRVEAARLLARMGRGDQALELVREDGDAEERLARVSLLLRLRREMDADRLLSAIGAAAGGVRGRLLRAELLERRQELDRAEAELLAAAEALDGAPEEPGLLDARFTAGYLALALGRPGEARAFFRAALAEARDPSRRADALFDLSVAAAAEGAHADAERALEEALALFSSLGERDRYVSALGQRAALALGRSDAAAAYRDLEVVLARDRQPGRGHQLLFSVPLRQRLALAEGDDAEGAEAFAEAAAVPGERSAHPAWREVLVLEGARLLAAGLAAAALSRLEEAAPLADARSGVEPLRRRVAASALRDLGRPAPLPAELDGDEASLLDAEERLSRGLNPPAAAWRLLAARLETPGGPVAVTTRLLEWRGRFPGAFSGSGGAALRDLGERAARRAGLGRAAARLAAGAERPGRDGERPAGGSGPGVVAEDASTRELFETARKVAATRLSVLVLGESGTGKEVVAQEIHRASGRSGPFVAVNVAALVESLAEAELFGAARGAYTGADRDRAGVLEASSGGTLFLDEIGDLSPRIQAKLLRVLQEREVRRLGETRTRPVDLRLVTATHRDLARLCTEGRFREDLLYRIAQLSLTLGPLRERPRDLRALLEAALDGTPLSPEARAAFLSWRWPGNVRELLSAVESARALAGPGERIETDHLPPALRSAPGDAEEEGGRYRAAVDEAKRRVILEALAETGGNRTRAAALLGLSRQSLLYELKRLAIRD
jgi:DNA-binding NtrC family response regulator/tetratricopeptide (TPR) repeat protein